MGARSGVVTASVLASIALGNTGCSGDAADGDRAAPIIAVTFNSGTPALPGTTGDTADQWYGNGLAWNALVEDARRFFQELQPDLVSFQEIFHPEVCATIPADEKAGFVCESWQPGDPTVAQIVLGPGYRVACHLGKPDKCVGVKTSFGRLAGCDADLCLDGLKGAEVAGCGSGSRVGRGVIELTGGGQLTLVSVHGSSGASQEDQDCRVQQFAQIFDDLGTLDGPAANGERNLIAGDLNTDPGRHGDFDESASAFAQHVGEGRPFHFLSDVGPDAVPTYGGLFNIDHVASDAFDGKCWTAGVTPGHPPLTAQPGFDHKPLVCEVGVE